MTARRWPDACCSDGIAMVVRLFDFATNVCGTDLHEPTRACMEGAL